MAAARLLTSILVKILLRCLATVFSLRNKIVAIPRLVCPCATRASTSHSRAVNGCPGTAPSAGASAARSDCGAQLLEDHPSGIELHPRGVVVAELPTCRTDHNPGTRSLVRRVDLLPERPRLPKKRQGGLRITLGKPNVPTCMGCKCCEVRGLDCGRIVFQLGQRLRASRR